MAAPAPPPAAAPAAAAAAARAAALAALAETPPRAWLEPGPSGRPALEELHARCAAAGLAPAAPPPSDLARLHALFDVALAHGLAAVVADYVADVCADLALTSPDPAAALLRDGEAVRRWAAGAAAAGRQRLAGWLALGLPALGGLRGAVAAEAGRLRALALLAEALGAPGGGGGALPAPDAAGRRRRAADAAATAAAAAPPPSSEELLEARRLAQAAAVLEWLSCAPLAHARASGRFASEQEWRGVAHRRRDAARAAGLGATFWSELAGAAGAAGAEPPPYPPPGPERLVAALFLAGDSSEEALRAKLACLAYYLADGGFLPPADLPAELGRRLGVLPPAAVAWVLRLFLDDAGPAAPPPAPGLPAAGDGAPPPGGALAQAANFLPGCDAGALPFQALRCFLRGGRADVALRLLRQRPGAGGGGPLDEAAAALAVRLANGLLAEAFIEARRHLAAVGAAAPAALPAHAERLVGDLLAWGAANGGLHAVARLPLAPGPEEDAAVAWLAAAAGEVPQAGLMLSLFYLIRGRAPEALAAYAAHCPAADVDGGGEEEMEEGGRLGELRAQLAALLGAAARALPAPQAGLATRRAAAPALRAAGADGAGGAAPLAAGLPGAGAPAAPALVAEGPSLAATPFVGSVAAMAAGARAARGAGGGGGAAPAAPAPRPLLFGGGPAGGSAAGTPRAGTPAPFAPATAGTPGGGGGGGARHELDRVLGLAAAPAASAGRRRVRR